MLTLRCCSRQLDRCGFPSSAIKKLPTGENGKQTRVRAVSMMKLVRERQSEMDRRIYIYLVHWLVNQFVSLDFSTNPYSCYVWAREQELSIIHSLDEDVDESLMPKECRVINKSCEFLMDGMMLAVFERYGFSELGMLYAFDKIAFNALRDDGDGMADLMDQTKR